MAKTPRELSVLCRVEMDATALSAWTNAAIDPEHAEGISDADWTGYIRRAYADGDLEEELPNTVGGCLAYLDQPELGILVARHPDWVEIAFDRASAIEHDMVFARGALAAIVFEHAVAHGADAYLWLAGAGSVMAEIFFHAHAIGRDGELIVEEDEESTEYGSLEERFSELLWDNDAGWSVAHDLAATPDGEL